MSAKSPKSVPVSVSGLLRSKHGSNAARKINSEIASNKDYIQELSKTDDNLYTSKMGVEILKKNYENNLLTQKQPKHHKKLNIKDSDVPVATTQNWMIETPIKPTAIEQKKENIQTHYSKEYLKQLSDEELDSIHKALETEYDKFSRKIYEENSNIKMDEKELEEMLKNKPEDKLAIDNIKKFIIDSKQLILQFTELKQHIKHSLHQFDELDTRRKILKEIVKRQIIKPISTRKLSSAELKQIEGKFQYKRPSSAKSGIERHYYYDRFPGGKRARTRKTKKTRSRK
jgi:hypothetical protein